MLRPKEKSEQWNGGNRGIINKMQVIIAYEVAQRQTELKQAMLK